MKNLNKFSLIQRAVAAHVEEEARMAREKREREEQEMEAASVRARRVAANVLHLADSNKTEFERIPFERTSDPLGCPAFVFEMDGLLLRVRDGDKHLSVRCNGEWHTVYTLSGLGKILAQGDFIEGLAEAEGGEAA
jgi:hypothetical protein